MTHFHQYWRALFAARLRRLRPAIDASLDRVAAHGDPREPGSDQSPQGQIRRIGKSANQAVTDLDPNAISKTRSGSSQRTESSPRSACDLAVRGRAGNSATAMQPER
jgi:hypothetical protein